MNNIYRFQFQNNIYYIAAKNWKEARNMIVRLPEFQDQSLTDITGKIIRKKATTEIGFLSQEIVYDQFPWWTCRCGHASFLPLDDGSSWRCKKCGRESRNFT